MPEFRIKVQVSGNVWYRKTTNQDLLEMRRQIIDPAAECSKCVRYLFLFFYSFGFNRQVACIFPERASFSICSGEAVFSKCCEALNLE